MLGPRFLWLGLFTLTVHFGVSWYVLALLLYSSDLKLGSCFALMLSEFENIAVVDIAVEDIAVFEICPEDVRCGV